MCGIAGIIGKCASVNQVMAMVKALQRRGPDDYGVWSDSRCPVILGHARLSIIDLSAAGHQPMLLEGDTPAEQLHSAGNVRFGEYPTANAARLAVVLNGEIYNYRELRRELETHGAVFFTSSDTEVLLHAWRRWGRETPNRLRGMFAFAFWDSAARQLTLVRDRLGIKPLLWHQGSDCLVFASSLKAMLASGAVSPTMDPLALQEYLLQGAVLQPRTMIQGVQSLEPGVVQEFTLATDGQVTKGACHTYWNMARDAARVEALASLPYEQQVAATRTKLEEACRYHMIADVPVGSFLSGGVDSTAITALMARLSGKKINSFSIGFSTESGMAHELDAARQAAAYIGCNHTGVILCGRDVAEQFDDFIEVLDQPSVDGLNTYWVSRIARQHGLKVALSGLGGDELFAGYPHFQWAIEAAKRGRPTTMDQLCAFLFGQLPYARLPPERCRRGMSFDDQMSTLRRCMRECQVANNLAPGWRHRLEKRLFQKYLQRLALHEDEPMARLTLYECRNYLLNILLRDADALSMGHGLEVRPVFLDHHIVEHATHLPPASKWRGDRAKAVLKDATADLLPPGFFQRRKTGFILPIHFWLDRELRESMLATFAGKEACALFSRQFIRELSRPSASRRVSPYRWQIFVLLRWLIHAGIL
jgi:asparagine synthase (glutamine-hydrolysing)